MKLLINKTLMLTLVLGCTTLYFGNEFTVIAKSGKVTVIDRVSKGSIPLKIGDKLQINDKIELDYGGYLVIVDPDSKSIEINKKGTYSLSDISRFSTAKSNSIMENITKFLLTEMSTADTQYKEMKTLGAVVRKAKYKLDISVPYKTSLLDSLYTLSWFPSHKKESSYILRIFNNAGSTLYMEELMDTSFIMHFQNYNLNYDQDYYWTVYDKSYPMAEIDSISFSLISPKERDRIKNELLTLKKDFMVKDSPYNNLLLAKYLTERDLNLSALEYYKLSVDLNPDSEFYWGHYLKFLMEVGLEKKAIQEWSRSPFSRATENKN